MRILPGCGGLIVLMATLGQADDKPTKIDSKMLVGKWAPREAPKGAKVVIEMTKEGKLNIAMEFGGKTDKIRGTYTVQGNTVTFVVQINGNEAKDVITVQKLTARELVTKDQKGLVETLVRIQEKNK